MEQPGRYTRDEIMSQPAAWAATLAALDAEGPPLWRWLAGQPFDGVVFTGCGSPYYLALAAAALLGQLGPAPAQAAPASEVWLAPGRFAPPGRRTLLVALSRSGETTESVRAVEAFGALGRGASLALVCYPDRPLARAADAHLVLPAGQERSVAQTRAFSVLLLAATALAAGWSGDDSLRAALDGLPAAGQRVLEGCGPLAASLAADEGLRRVFFLGSGPRYGLACELSLKLKEMSLSESEPFHVLEFRHGPQAMAGPQALIVGLPSARHAAHEGAVLSEMAALGARVVAVGPGAAGVDIGEGLPEAAALALYLPFGQLLAYERAVGRGLDPDRPHNLTAVVRLGP